MYLKHMCIVVMICFCSGVYTMQQKQSVAACIVKNILRGGKVTGAATKNLVGSGALWAWHKKNDFAVSGLVNAATGYVLPRVLGASDTQIQYQREHEEIPGRFDIPKMDIYKYLGWYINKLLNSQELKDASKVTLVEIGCDYAANIMQKATLHLLSDLHMLPHVPGPLIAQSFVSGFGKTLLLEGMRDWFARPCMRFGARVRKLGFNGACRSLLGLPK